MLFPEFQHHNQKRHTAMYALHYDILNCIDILSQVGNANETQKNFLNTYP